jgi:undecaprenyl-phosphate 4-deoxy-4-formamido-L-arabinose transferase
VINKLSVVIPVYNSESTIVQLVQLCAEELSLKYANLEFVLVNDGSADRSHELILKLLNTRTELDIKYLNLARNFGEHNAVMCGLRHSNGDATAIIDDDFQNPPKEIVKLVDRLEDGYDVVYSYFNKKKHSRLRNLGSKFNDRIASLMLAKPDGLYLSSFKVMNRFTAKAVCEYQGPFPYIDGLILRSTTRIGTQLCEHRTRAEGESNYTLRKLISLWLSMLTSFSVLPLRVASYLGILMSAVGFLLALFFIVSWAFKGVSSEAIPRGWASLIVSITIFSGIQLMVLGMVGEYIGRIFMTQNKQPQFIIRSSHSSSTGNSTDDV